jgi:hypothetical protein
MGFGSFLLELGKDAVSSIVEKAENLQDLKYKYDRYSDSELISQLKTSSGDTRLVINSILKERGYNKKS